MHITFLAPCKDLSGGIKVIATYGNKLVEKGHTVTVVYPKSTQPIKRRIKRSLIKIVKQQQDHLDRFKGKLMAVKEVNNKTIPDGDVLIATAWETAEWAGDLSEAKGRKFYFIQGHEVWNGQQKRVYNTLKLPFKKITISTWLQKLLTEISGDKEIIMISNASDFKLDQKTKPFLQRQYDIGMTYSSIANKGSGLGLQAIRTIAEDYPELKFVLFGTEAPTEALPPNTSVFVKPSQKKIGEIYRSTRIWLSTSYEEGFCLPCLEAMSSGAVVISTDNKGVSDIVDHIQNGFITETGSSRALVEKITFLLENPAEMKRLQTAGYKKSETFSWDESTAQLEKILLDGNKQGLAA